MAISGIGRTGYPVGYETRRTEKNITSKNIAGKGGVYNESWSNAMQSGSQDCLKNNFMDNYTRYIKETGIYTVKADNINEASETGAKGTEIENQIQEYFEKLFVKIENGEAKADWTESTEETQGEDGITDMQVNMLVSETVQARFPLQELDEEGNRKEDIYLIAVDKDGIRCSKPGQSEYEWEILFTDESQYEKAIEFLNYAGEFMDNFRFAAHENFWEDYLNGNMDVDGFKEFLQGTNNGTPDYSFTVGDSMYIDKEKVQWAQYMNPLGTKIYTAEEMAKMQAEVIEKNTATLHKLSDPYSILYKKVVDPNYNGERIFCEYPGGPLYTADEIMEVMNRNLKDAKYQAAARK